MTAPTSPAEWHGHARIDTRHGERHEFRVPVLDDGELRAFVRLGFAVPPRFAIADQLGFIAGLALPMFLLVPLAWFLLRRELSGVRRAAETLEHMQADGDIQPIDADPGTDVSRFGRAFNAAAELLLLQRDAANSRVAELDTSLRVVRYRFQRMEQVLEALPDAIVVLDDTGTVSFSNAKTASHLGASPDVLRGRPLEDACGNEDVREFLQRSRRSSGSGYLQDSMEYRPSATSDRTLRINLLPLLGAEPGNGGAARSHGTLVVVRDATTEALARDSRETFVAHVAHELKTPLNVLAMYAEALQGPDGADEAFRTDAVNVLGDEVERLSMLISNLLSITKIEMGTMGVERTRVRLPDFLGDTFTTMQRAASRDTDLQFEADIPAEMPHLLVDKDLLRVAVNNLLTNAIKYNRPGGTVFLRAAEDDQAVTIEVTDTGIGISPEAQAHVFEKFYRAEDDAVRERAGHGLGLALANEIVLLHNGSLTVESTPGQGTTFRIRLDREANLLRQAS